MLVTTGDIQRTPAVHGWVDGKRYHLTKAGCLPGVTTILSATKPERDRAALEDWKRRVGDEEAERIKVEACNNGTKVHGEVEGYLRGEIRLDALTEQVSKYQIILKKIERVLAVEASIYHTEGFAGSPDCVAMVDSKLSVLDWKSSRRAKRKEWVIDYYLQCAAYSKAVEQMWGWKVEQTIIAVVSPERVKAQIFTSDAATIELHWQAFLKRLRQYQEITGGSF